ncbi:hypothetical protein SAMN02982917_1686 [Azospirillum oryzae]|uniref:DUF4148 domain-containing protein n=1 Tax=Azospirillum oryzae TaxID=286727 RepID=A0A1X7EH91_9PROT|nr:hypothetical protein [Azospirillum oryzae]SMF33841.1 hypothetical protein SAMN02982917_1686 [Azospirillum oryzae]
MSIRKTAATALFSAVLLASGASFAASSTGSASFADQLSEARAALQQTLPGGVGRTEVLQVERDLSIAQDLNRQGKTAQAQSYLNHARGTLDLPFRDGEAPVASNQGGFTTASGDYGSIYR